MEYYNNKRPPSALGYISPKDKLLGRENEIFSERERKLEDARIRRAKRRQELRARFQKSISVSN